MAADRIHIAEPNPAYCSGCYQQKPQQRHVDFDATYDGPVAPPLGNVAGAKITTIDELILCEDCLRIAARLIGYEDVTELHDRLNRAEQTRDTLLEKVAALEEHNQHLRQAVASGQQVERVMRPPAIAPKPAASSRQSAPKPRSKPPQTGGRRRSAAAKAAEGATQ